VSPRGDNIHPQFEGTRLMERIAHRGAKRELPENTIAAFKRAFERRADAVELDVHATRDGVVVVHHDPTLGSTFGALSGRPIRELDWPRMAGASVSASTRIPTLAEVLGIAPPGATVYVEIKGSQIEAEVAEVIGTSHTRCAVHSFDHGAVRRMRELAPQIPRGILLDRRVADLPAVMAEAGARDVWPEWTLIDGPMVERIHGAGGRVIAWTVNDRTAAAKLMTLGWTGVDGLCTDDIRLLDGL
jgi:glycerophosphoryl diester phosphodiesterase